MQRSYLLRSLLVVAMLLATVLRAKADDEEAVISPAALCSSYFPICSNYPKQTSQDIWVCLLENRQYIDFPTCVEYIEGIFTCLKDLNSSDRCVTEMFDFTGIVRHCMRAKEPHTISKECSSTSFYRSARSDLGENEVRLRE